MPDATLHLGENTLSMTTGATQHMLPIGLATVSQTFAHHMPNALALENAIACVEDAIMPAIRWIPPGLHTLHSASPQVAQLIQSATGQSEARSASREAVENLFSALARQAQQPGFQDLQLVQTAEAAATLLILREAMHHWGIEQLVWQPEADQTS